MHERKFVCRHGVRHWRPDERDSQRVAVPNDDIWTHRNWFWRKRTGVGNSDGDRTGSNRERHGKSTDYHAGTVGDVNHGERQCDIVYWFWGVVWECALQRHSTGHSDRDRNLHVHRHLPGFRRFGDRIGDGHYRDAAHRHHRVVGWAV